MYDRVQNLHPNLINKKALVLFEKLALNTKLAFTCSKSGIETLDQVVRVFPLLTLF